MTDPATEAPSPVTIAAPLTQTAPTPAPPATPAQPATRATAPPRPRRIVPRTPDPHSSPEDRRLYRESSPQFHAHAVAVRRILSQRPGLRAATSETDEAIVIDFAALLDLLADDQPRQGEPGLPEAAQEARLTCAVSGARRLPSFRGAVFCPANLPGAGAESYVTSGIV